MWLLTIICNIIYYLFIILCTICFLMFATKPHDETIDPFIKEFTAKLIRGKTSNTIEIVASKALSSVATIMTNRTIDDYIIFKIATVNIGDKRYFIGVFNNWVCLE